METLQKDEHKRVREDKAKAKRKQSNKQREVEEIRKKVCQVIITVPLLFSCSRVLQV